MLEPLSSEYLTALSSCASDEINQLLCSSTELNQQLQKQADQAGQKPYDDYDDNDNDNDILFTDDQQDPQRRGGDQERPTNDAPNVQEQEIEEGDSLLVAPITASQTLLYLNLIVTRSPSFQRMSSSNNFLPPQNASSGSGSIVHSSGTAMNTRSSSTGSTTPMAVPPMQLLINIRNAVKILAHSQQHRHSISSCGILDRLLHCLLLYSSNNHCNSSSSSSSSSSLVSGSWNAIVYIEFLECCLLAGQYSLARKYMNVYESSFSSFSSSKGGTLYPHIVSSIPGGSGGGSGSGIGTREGNDYSPTLVFARYHYLRGMVLYACEEVSNAIVEWEHCLRIPHGGARGGGIGDSHYKRLDHQVIVNAWKKWTLAKCLLCQYDDEVEMQDADKNNFGGMVVERGEEEIDPLEKEKIVIRGDIRHVGDAGRLERTQERPPWGKEDEEEEQEQEQEVGEEKVVVASKSKSGGGRINMANDRVKKWIMALPRGTSVGVNRLLLWQRGKRRLVGKGIMTVPVVSSADGTCTTTNTTTTSQEELEKEVERYTWLVEEFVKGELGNLFKSGQEHSVKLQYFERDGNVGMIQRLLPVVRWRTLRKISKIYSAMSIPQLSKKLDMGPSECTEFLLQVASQQDFSSRRGEDYRAPIEFRVDGEKGVVYFEEQDIERDYMMYLEEKLGKSMALANRIKDLDVSVANSSQYQMNLWKNVVEQR